jgi:hypothetical protein
MKQALKLAQSRAWQVIEKIEFFGGFSSRFETLFADCRGAGSGR